MGNEKKFKIGEVCRIAGVQPYVLRYWETEFPPLAPGKSGGGQRLYTQREIDVILRIKALLYDEGFTIAGAKKKLESDGETPAAASATARASAPPKRRRAPKEKDVLRSVREELQSLLELLS
ncbi:MAG: MerR family transcriptional regulator [Thermoanaerobaculia bacterium]